MTRWALLALLVAFAVRGTAAAAPTEEAATALDPFGKVDLYRERDAPGRVVLFLSDADGWNRPDVESARALASLDALVVGVDVPRYLATIAARGGDVFYPFADLELLSQFVQKKLRLPRYVAPILIGRGIGATLAYAVAAAARPNEFAAAVSLGFCPEIALPKPLGPGGDLQLAPARAGVWRLRPASTLTVPWTVLHGHADPGCDPDDARRFADAAPGTERMTLATSEQIDDPEDWLPRVRHVLDRVSAPVAAVASGAGDVVDLPLVEVPAHGMPRALAVILSGDGGWASLDREVGDALAAAGVGVVGVNSLAYFWTKRTPAGAAADLARVLRAFRARWQTPRVVLIGYSRGADVLPFLASRLPAELRAAVVLVALLGPARTTDFEFHLTDWLGGDDPSALPVAPEVARLAGLRVLCVHGEDEDESLCPTLDPARVTRMALSGGHHFGGDYGLIARRILSEAQLDADPPSPPPSVVPSPGSGVP